jgi:hypothetical protein
MLALICVRHVSLRDIEKGKYPEEYFPFCFVEQTTQKNVTYSKLIRKSAFLLSFDFYKTFCESCVVEDKCYFVFFRSKFG